MTDPRYPIGPFVAPAAFTPAQRATAIEQIAAAPAALRRAVAGLSPAQLAARYRDGGWTVRQVVHHVPDSHLNAYIRFKLGLTEECPTIKPYDQARWAETAEVAVVSRIGDRGLDLPDLTLVVEVAGAGASREQFAQRVGRLLHGTFSGEFHTVFTPEEAEKFRPRIFGVEAELAGEVEIQFVNVGVLAETSANEKPIRRPGPVARPAAIKPGDEIGATLANPAVAKAIEKAYADAPAQVRSEKKIHAALRVAWDTAITLAELEAGRGIRGRALTNWKAAFAVAAKHKLTVKIGEGWMTNKAHLKKLVELSGRFKR